MPKNNFSFQPSKQYVIILTIVLIASSLIIVFYIPSYILKITALFLLLIYGKCIWQAALLKNPDAILGINYIDTDRWLLQTPSVEYDATLRGESVVTPYFCILRFQAENRRLSSLIMRDSLLSGEYRSLLVRLRW